MKFIHRSSPQHQEFVVTEFGKDGPRDEDADIDIYTLANLQASGNLHRRIFIDEAFSLPKDGLQMLSYFWRRCYEWNF